MPLQQRTTDYHCHILPGIDDGAADEAASIAMARLLFHAGYREVYCTPHLIKGMYDVTHAEILRLRDHLQAELDREGIAMRLLTGREYYLDEYLLELLREPQPLEGTNIIMVEIPSHTSADLVKESLYTISRKGYTPMIAHPERCHLLETVAYQAPVLLRFWSSSNRSGKGSGVESNELLSYLRHLGCLFQANLGSLNGQYGNQVKTRARSFMSAGIFTHAGTDAHAPDALTNILRTH